MSVPETREEVALAEKLSAVVNKEKKPTKSKILTDYYRSESTKQRPHTSHHATTLSPRTPISSARSAVRESLVPTPVNISNQGIQNLRAQREFLSWESCGGWCVWFYFFITPAFFECDVVSSATFKSGALHRKSMIICIMIAKWNCR